MNTVYELNIIMSFDDAKYTRQKDDPLYRMMTPGDVVHAFCSRSVTLLLRCTTLYHVVVRYGEMPANFEHVQNLNFQFTFCHVFAMFCHVSQRS